MALGILYAVRASGNVRLIKLLAICSGDTVGRRLAEQLQRAAVAGLQIRRHPLGLVVILYADPSAGYDTENVPVGCDEPGIGYDVCPSAAVRSWAGTYIAPGAWSSGIVTPTSTRATTANRAEQNQQHAHTRVAHRRGAVRASRHGVPGRTSACSSPFGLLIGAHRPHFASFGFATSATTHRVARRRPDRTPYRERHAPQCVHSSGSSD